MNTLMDFGGGVSWIWIIIIGGLAGWIAEKATKSDHGLIRNVIVGIIGSLIGDRIVKLLNLNVEAALPGSWFLANLLVSAAGAIILLVIVKAIRK
jgi:uncharacterized membrane protein YeaQ/YmgE (transglycosylase-associated protein family)